VQNTQNTQLTLTEITQLIEARVVAGVAGLGNGVSATHILEQPDWQPWVRGGELVLTTGMKFPKNSAAQEEFIRAPARLGVSGLLLAVGRFRQTFPKAMLQTADELGFPLLELPFAVPFVDVTQTVHLALLQKKEALIEHADRLQRQISQAAVFAKSLQDLTDAFGEILQTCVVFSDPQRRILAISHSFDDPWQKLRTDQSIPQHWQATESTLEPLLAIDRMACAVRDAGGFRGALWLRRRQQPELETRVLVHAATVFAVHLAQQQTKGLIESRLNYNILDALLAGLWDTDSLLQERARLLGYQPQQRYRMVMLSLLERTDAPKLVSNTLVASLEGFASRELLAEKLSKLLQDLGAAPLVTLSLARVVLLFPDDHNKLMALLARLDMVHLAVLVGSVSETPQQLPAVFSELERLSKQARSPGIHRVEEMLLERLLEQVRHSELAQTLQRDLERSLAAYPELFQTLEVLVWSGFHQGKTAKRLGIHQNTLTYRLGRLQTLVGYSANPEVQFKLALAVRLRQKTV
jgi:PucR family transcriptional regulator, purine catabolism regulatory protein